MTFRELLTKGHPVHLAPHPMNFAITELVGDVLSESNRSARRFDACYSFDRCARELEPYGYALGNLISDDGVEAEVDVRDCGDGVLHQHLILVQ